MGSQLFCPNKAHGVPFCTTRFDPNHRTKGAHDCQHGSPCRYFQRNGLVLNFEQPDCEQCALESGLWDGEMDREHGRFLLPPGERAFICAPIQRDRNTSEIRKALLVTGKRTAYEARIVAAVHFGVSEQDIRARLVRKPKAHIPEPAL